MNAPTPQDEGMYDAMGRFVPISLIKPIDLARHELVEHIVQRAQVVSDAISKFKAAALGDIDAFVQLSAEQYGANLGGHKGNVTLVSFDGRFKVVRQIQEHIVFDERLQVAKALIDECITTWAAGSRDEIRVLVQDAFQVSKEGKISTSRVLGLRRLEITGTKWLEAMRAISDSIQSAGSKTYIRIYERVGQSDQYRLISLDAAGV
jgi:hypothetical protein